MERIQYLMSLLTENYNDAQEISPQLHKEISEDDMFPIKITLTQINQTQFVTSVPVFSETSSDLDKQVERLQPRQQTPMLWNPYLRLPWMLPQRDTFMAEPLQAPNPAEQTAQMDNPDGTIKQNPKKPDEQKYTWTENIHIEFPSIILCRKPSDELSQAFFTAIKNYEKELIDFTDNHIEIRRTYINIIDWLDSIKNQEGQNLQNAHPLFNFTVYNIQFNQIPDFILNSIDEEQKEKLIHIINLSRRYSWMNSLYFEYRKCLPTIFRENLLISYSAPIPLQMESPSRPSLQAEQLSDIDILYELSIHTSPFASSFKQSYPIKIFRQSYVDWNDFTLNDLKVRYEPEWSEALQFLQQLILQNRTHLDVSF